MTKIDFYFNAEDRLQVACRLAGKAHARRQRLMIFAPGETAQKIDRLLWTWPATGFVPHCAAHDPLAPDTGVLISGTGDAAEPCTLLLNLDDDCPPHFERFERLLEVVSREDADRARGRARFRYYRDRGYEIRSHDLAQESRHGG